MSEMSTCISWLLNQFYVSSSVMSHVLFPTHLFERPFKASTHYLLATTATEVLAIRSKQWKSTLDIKSKILKKKTETAFNQKLRVEWSVAIDSSAWLVIEWAGTRSPSPQSPGRKLAPSDTTSAAWEISQRGYDCPAINAPHPLGQWTW